jgi:hypothetical protein
MKREMVDYATVDITALILVIRGKRVILDRDLAALYGVPTFRFNEAVLFDIAICDVKVWAWRTTDSSLCLYGTRHCYGCQYLEVSKGRADERVCCAGVHPYATDAC